jgi:hypothetical protein
MKIHVDADVAKVAEFMVRNVPAVKLDIVARSLVQISELLWAHHMIPIVKSVRVFAAEYHNERSPELNRDLSKEQREPKEIAPPSADNTGGAGSISRPGRAKDGGA